MVNRSIQTKENLLYQCDGRGFESNPSGLPVDFFPPHSSGKERIIQCLIVRVKHKMVSIQTM